MIHLVCIDFWNTLYENVNKNYRKEYIYNLLYHAFNYKFSKNQISYLLNIFDENSNNVQYNNIDRLNYLEECLHYNLNKDIKISLDTSISESVTLFSPKLNHGIIDFFKLCKKNNIKIILVSDTNYSYSYSIKKILKNDNIYEYFDYFVFSDETMIRKPNPIIFRSICDKYNVLPEECFFIGDSEKKDIIGAKQCNYNTAKKCPIEKINNQSEANIKFCTFLELINKFIEGGIFN